VISDKALELNISLVLEVRGDSVECIGMQVIKPGGGLAGNGIDPHRAMTRTGKETSGTNGVPPWCVSHAHVSGKGPAQDGAQHEEKKEEPIGTTADCRNTWIFQASSEFSDVRSARVACCKAASSYSTELSRATSLTRSMIQIKRRPGRRYISEVLEINSCDAEGDPFDYCAIYQR
jgi:hypothetical protein